MPGTKAPREKKKILLVIIVGTAALEACTSIIALIKVFPV